jgi:hypothetical protein
MEMSNHLTESVRQTSQYEVLETPMERRRHSDDRVSIQNSIHVKTLCSDDLTDLVRLNEPGSLRTATDSRQASDVESGLRLSE